MTRYEQLKRGLTYGANFQTVAAPSLCRPLIEFGCPQEEIDRRFAVAKQMTTIDPRGRIEKGAPK